MRALTVAVATIAVLLTGCSDTTSGGGTPTAGPATSADQTTEPTTEGTGPETAQTKQNQPSIQIASAPIGGNVDTNGLEQCAEVNWLGRNPIPDGTRIKLGSPGLDPVGVFKFDQSSCSDDLRPCSEVTWQTDNFKPCYVGVRQVANGSEDVSLIIPVDATCASQDDCNSLTEGSDGTQIKFSPDTIDTPSETPTGN